MDSWDLKHVDEDVAAVYINAMICEGKLWIRGI